VASTRSHLERPAPVAASLLRCQGLESQRFADRNLVYVSADHGFDQATKRHSAARHIFLGTDDARVKTHGEQRDSAPTVLSEMGVDLSTITPRLPGKCWRSSRYFPHLTFWAFLATTGAEGDHHDKIRQAVHLGCHLGCERAVARLRKYWGR
jgi:hypothetical protein